MRMRLADIKSKIMEIKSMSESKKQSELIDAFETGLVNHIKAEDKPEARQIQWIDVDGFESQGDDRDYAIFHHEGKGYTCRHNGQRINQGRYLPSLNEAKRRCQDHKQGLLDELEARRKELVGL